MDTEGEGGARSFKLGYNLKNESFVHGGKVMKTTKPDKTIAQIFEEFLADQKPRISDKTYQKYESIIDLYGSYLESYWPRYDGEGSKITKAGGTYCGTFGPEDATAGYGESPCTASTEEPSALAAPVWAS